MARLEPREIRELAGRFVLVRLGRIEEFPFEKAPFDFDMSFAAFFLNADGAVYGRYGSRDAGPKEAHRLLSFPSLAQSMKRALALHAAYPGNRAALAGKRGSPLPWTFPVERAKEVRSGSVKRPSNSAIKNCNHCHSYNEHIRQEIFLTGAPFPGALLWQYPLPEVVGFAIDLADGARVQKVDPGSPAALAGLIPGDEILAMGGQPILSLADIQWVLHTIPDETTLTMEVLRAGLGLGEEKTKRIDLRLSGPWRQRTDFSWRSMRAALAVGNMPESKRAELGIPKESMALRFWPGRLKLPPSCPLKEGDVIVELDGRSDRMDSNKFVEAIFSRHPSDREIRATVLRDGKRISIVLRPDASKGNREEITR